MGRSTLGVRALIRPHYSRPVRDNYAGFLHLIAFNCKLWSFSIRSENTPKVWNLPGPWIGFRGYRKWLDGSVKSQLFQICMQFTVRFHHIEAVSCFRDCFLFKNALWSTKEALRRISHRIIRFHGLWSVCSGLKNVEKLHQHYFSKRGLIRWSHLKKQMMKTCFTDAHFQSPLLGVLWDLKGNTWQLLQLWWANTPVSYISFLPLTEADTVIGHI